MELLSKSEGKPSPYVTLGKIIAPHGLKGALKVFLLSDFPERFLELEQLFLLTDPDAAKAQGPFHVENIQHVKGKQYLLFLKELKTRTAAEALEKRFIGIPATAAEELPEDTFYARDLIGFAVTDTAGHTLGQVSQVIQSHQDLIVVQTPDAKEHWIPFVVELVPEVDVPGRRLVIAPVEGLLEL